MRLNQYQYNEHECNEAARNSSGIIVKNIVSSICNSNPVRIYKRKDSVEKICFSETGYGMYFNKFYKMTGCGVHEFNFNRYVGKLCSVPGPVNILMKGFVLSIIICRHCRSVAIMPDKIYKRKDYLDSIDFDKKNEIDNLCGKNQLEKIIPIFPLLSIVEEK